MLQQQESDKQRSALYKCAKVIYQYTYISQIYLPNAFSFSERFYNSSSITPLLVSFFILIALSLCFKHSYFTRKLKTIADFTFAKENKRSFALG